MPSARLIDSTSHLASQWTVLILCAFFWGSPWRLNFICRRFGKLFHLHRLVPGCLWRWYRHCSETSAYNIQKPGNYPEESTQHSEHGESLKSSSNIILPPSLTSSDWSVSVWTGNQIGVCSCHMRVTYPTHLILDLYIIILFGEDRCRLLSSQFCRVLQPPVLSTLFQ
jgi:hypothetical protein